MMVDDDVEVMDDEGFIDPFPSKGRQMNYTIQEDETLVLAWEAITLDAVHGVEQSGSTYWQRIHEHYHQIKNTPGDRTQKSLTNRWSAIQDTCSKWASAMEQVERLNPSGTNQNDRINIAQKYFRQLTSKNGKLGKPFNMQHCYALLLHDEKWRTQNDEMPNKESKSASNSYSPDVEDIGDSSHESDSEDAKRSPTPNSVEKKRPLGRKKEKARLKKEKEGTCKDSIEMIMATKKSLAAERKEEKAQTFMQIKALEERRIAFEAHRVQLEERTIAIKERREKSRQEKREQQLMFMNSSNLDDQGKAYLKLMRDQIMASKTMGGFMPGFFMGGGGGMGDGGGMGGGTSG
ncbi:hypothetical protein BRADI_2g36772v3 [Brachypodium distachyon]|uniref:No apical meristem-associated C-terminal domain-containing protein n=1 Tax=Brachypodium distachyon TaxID=15368 RepID=A0A0Q3IP61_BRADI|nr:hypothetical protein BRADI_2g36772v3 [Brachypodium distachyon]